MSHRFCWGKIHLSHWYFWPHVIYLLLFNQFIVFIFTVFNSINNSCNNFVWTKSLEEKKKKKKKKLTKLMHKKISNNFCYIWMVNFASKQSWCRSLNSTKCFTKKNHSHLATILFFFSFSRKLIIKNSSRNLSFFFLIWNVNISQTIDTHNTLFLNR